MTGRGCLQMGIQESLLTVFVRILKTKKDFQNFLYAYGKVLQTGSGKLDLFVPPEGRVFIQSEIFKAKKKTYFWRKICVLGSNRHVLGITDKFWVVTNTFWVITDKFWVVTDKFWVVTNKFWVVTDMFWVATDMFWVVTIIFRLFFELITCLGNEIYVIFESENKKKCFYVSQ